MSQVKLHSQQLVAEAIKFMCKEKENIFPVYDNGRAIGKITYKDLMDFLDREENGKNIYAHKLNFDLGSTLIAIRQMHAEVRKSSLKNDFARQLISGLGSAAVIAFALLGLAWWFFKPGAVPSEDQKMTFNPVSNKTILILANGKEIVLNDAKKGLIMTGQVLKYNDGTVLLDSAAFLKVTREKPGLMNTIAIPNGGKFEVILPDGTKVLLNAASSLKFPSDFSGIDQRKVELNGEAYFEVAKVNFKSKASGIEVERKMPFIVTSKGQEIEVLGTHFNVNAYNNEKNISTTLLEGSVRVTPLSQKDKLGGLDPSSLDPMRMMGDRSVIAIPNPGAAVVLKPNQQAILNGEDIAVKAVDAEEVIAWTNGEFIFRNMPLESIMRMLERWYNVEVSYVNKDAGTALLGGAISKSAKISEVLKMLELTANVHFKVDGRRIIVIE